MQARVVRRAEGHEQRVHNVVYEVQQRCEQQTEVATQTDEPLLRLQSRESGLKSEDVEQDGRHGADTLVIVVFGQQDLQPNK